MPCFSPPEYSHPHPVTTITVMTMREPSDAQCFWVTHWAMPTTGHHCQQAPVNRGYRVVFGPAARSWLQCACSPGLGSVWGCHPPWGHATTDTTWIELKALTSWPPLGELSELNRGSLPQSPPPLLKAYLMMTGV